MKTRALFVAALVAGCHAAQDGATVESNDLGVTQIEVEHSFQNGDRLMTVRGLDDSGREVAVATLRTGMVSYSMEPDVSPEVRTAGTELDISAGIPTIHYVNPDREPHVLSQPDESSLAAFVQLREVAAAFVAEAQIRFAQPASDGEVAFAAAACNGANFPIAKGNPSQCCVDGVDVWHKIPSGGAANELAYRTLGTPCTTQAGATGCTSDCWFGPAGGHVNAVATPNTTSATVFTPTSQPTQCGRDSNGATAGGGVEAPEPYASQALKPAVTSASHYTACATSGAPGVNITLVAKCQTDGGTQTLGASMSWGGNVVGCSAPAGHHTNTQSATFWFPYNSAQTISHSTGSPSNNSPGEPSVPTWSGWTGACSGTGTCTITASGDVTITAFWYYSAGL